MISTGSDCLIYEERLAIGTDSDCLRPDTAAEIPYFEKKIDNKFVSSLFR